MYGPLARSGDETRRQTGMPRFFEKGKGKKGEGEGGIGWDTGIDFCDVGSCNCPLV